MSAEKVRLNIVLPSSVTRELYEFSSPRKRSQFIAEAIRMRIRQLKKEKREELLKEGYKSSRSEGLQLAGEFEPFDIENWDEY